MVDARQPTGAGQEPRILVVEDHAAVATPMVAALRLEGFGEVASVPPDDLRREVVVSFARRFRAEVVLLDLMLGRFGTATAHIQPLSALGAAVVVLTASADRAALGDCLAAGAAACLDKSRPFDHIVRTVRAAAAGEDPMDPAERDALLAEAEASRPEREATRARLRRLTGREADVFRAMVDGMQAEEIAAALEVSVATVRTHIRSVLEKLGVHSQVAAVALARKAGWPPAG